MQKTAFLNYILSFIGALSAIGSLALLNQKSFEFYDSVFLIGSFGASAVLLYGAPHSPFSKSKNLIGGHVFSAIIGVTVAQIIQQQELLWLACALSVATAILVMQLTNTIHPPGGATALIAVIGSPAIKDLGYLYVIHPVLVGVLIMLIIARTVRLFDRRIRQRWKTARLKT